MRHDLPRFLTVSGKVLRGARRVVPVVAPAAGADWSAGPSGGRMWHVLFGRATFVASAAVANRLLGTSVKINGTEVWRVVLANNVTAGQTVQVTYTGQTENIAGLDPALFAAVPMPDLWLEPGDTIGSVTSAVDVADQYSALTLFVEESWIVNADIRDHLLEEEQELHRLATAALGG